MMNFKTRTAYRMSNIATVTQPRWNIYKSVARSRWVVWNTGWPWQTRSLLFDTWQEAMDYVNGKVES